MNIRWWEEREDEKDTFIDRINKERENVVGHSDKGGRGKNGKDNK